jgi:DNA-binding Xre family transcriptional regulator
MQKYLAITAKVSQNYAAWFADPILAVATGATREEVIAKLPKLLASALMHTPAIEPRIQSLAEVDPESLEGATEIESCFVALTAINPIAQAIDAAMMQNNISQAELARRMDISRAAVWKLVDPMRTAPYNLDTLERIAKALGMQLEPPKFVTRPPEMGSSLHQ